MSDLDLKERLRGMVSSDGAAIVCKDRTTREMTRDITEAADRIAALEDALRFYADRERWREYSNDEAASAFDRNFGSEFGHDEGALARAALEGDA